MGCGASTEEDRVNKLIERELAESKERFQSEVKVLLLGNVSPLLTRRKIFLILMFFYFLHQKVLQLLVRPLLQSN